ncbi:MAG TPA: hypothetical protein VE593_02975, partial [Nitrososphaeraceae archaeon]|nr:hypothetical protein [Nitrososphaeraceae archaeon]
FAKLSKTNCTVLIICSASAIVTLIIVGSIHCHFTNIKQIELWDIELTGKHLSSSFLTNPPWAINSPSCYLCKLILESQLLLFV